MTLKKEINFDTYLAIAKPYAYKFAHTVEEEGVQDSKAECWDQNQTKTFKVEDNKVPGPCKENNEHCANLELYIKR